VALGQVTDGTLSAADDRDFFNLTLTQSGTYSFYTTGTTDVHGDLYNSGYELIDYDGNNGIGNNFDITRTLGPGTYYLGITGAAGSYQAHFEGTNLQLVSISATSITLGSTASGSLLGNSDKDVYRLNVTQDAKYVLYTTGTTDTDGRLYNNNYDPLASGWGGGEGDNFAITYGLNPGTYYLEVSGAAGGYDLHVEGPGAGTVTDDHGFSPWSARAVSPGSTTAGTLSSSTDQDYFKLTVTQDAKYVLYTTGTTDTDGRLYNSNYDQLASGWGGGEGDNFAITYGLNPGTYYLEVSGAAGGYDLHVEGPGAGTVTDFADLISVAGGFYTAFADLSKAAYHLTSLEPIAPGQTGVSGVVAVAPSFGNYVKPYADDAWMRVGQHWQVLSASELGVAGEVSILNPWYISDEGVYFCENAAAFAVRCQDAVVISFRGTNDNDNALGTPDMADWFDMPAHYGELQYFIDAVDNYVTSQGIGQVYVTGHSLGGAMALGYMLNDAKGFGVAYEAVTFAAPGYVLSGSFDDRAICIEIDGDPVPDFKYKQGHAVSVQTDGLDYGLSVTKYHSMDLYLAAAKALDAELPNSLTSDASMVHGFDRGMFSTLNHGLEVVMAVNEFYPVDVEKYSWKDELAPQYLAMQDDNTLGDSTNLGASDYLLGGPGNDTLGARTLRGNDNEKNVLIGGDGNDRYYLDHRDDLVIERPDGGHDVVYSYVDTNQPDNVESLVLIGTAPVNVVGNALANVLVGNAGDNRLDGGAGPDTLSGGRGDDSYVVDSRWDTVIEWLSAGTDTVLSGVSQMLDGPLGPWLPGLSLSARTFNFWHTQFGNSLENLALTGADDTDGSGNALNNRIEGNAGDNRLSGGAGNDTLAGGAGLDVFRFDTTLNPAYNLDSVTDFSPAEDSIELENAVFARLAATGVLAAGRFSATGAAADADDFLVYDGTTGALYYDADGNGAGAAVQFAQLAGAPAVTAADFVVT